MVSGKPVTDTRRPAMLSVAIASAVLQSVCLLLVAVPALIVSSALCDGSSLCTTRGLRWLLWFGLSVALLVCLLMSTLAPRAAWADRWMSRLEIVVIALSLVASILAAGSVVVTIDVLLVLVILLGAVVLLGMWATKRKRSGPHEPD